MTMKAIVLTGFGGVENLRFREVPVPGIAADEVLVEVKAFSINPVDVKTRNGKGLAGRLKEYDPIIPGWDISGIVKQAGQSVTAFKPGDEVFGMINFPGHGKAYAQYVAAPAAHLAIKPGNISHTEAAAATLAALTAWQDLRNALDIQPGDTLLIHAAAGGVGHFAVQIAKHFGAVVIGTASSANKDFVLGLGADRFVDYRLQPLPDVISNVDKVLDTIGGENIELSLQLMKPGGTILSIVSGKNDQVQEKAAAKGMTGLTLMVHSSGEDQAKIARLMEQGIVKPHVYKTYAFDEIAEAHNQVESGRTAGKVVVTV